MNIRERALRCLCKVDTDTRAIISHLIAEHDLLEKGNQIAEITLQYYRNLTTRVTQQAEEIIELKAKLAEKGTDHESRTEISSYCTDCLTGRPCLRHPLPEIDRRSQSDDEPAISYNSRKQEDKLS